MQKIDFARSCEQTIIIVAPPQADVRVVRSAAKEIIAFTSSEEFHQYVAQSLQNSTIGDDVTAALTQVDCAIGSLPHPLRIAVEALAHQKAVPHVVDVEGAWNSRRSFYRMWCARIRETPSAFLRRVRAIHARRLLDSGMSRKEAALTSGFSSVDQMRRYVGRKSID